MRLVEIYYKSYNYKKVIEHLNEVEKLLKPFTRVSEYKSTEAEVNYYKGKFLKLVRSPACNSNIFFFKKKKAYWLFVMEKLMAIAKQQVNFL